MKKISLSIFGASLLALSAYAVNAPGTISVNSPSNAKTLYGSETLSFSWVASSDATKYYYVCDTNQSTIPATSSSKTTTTGTTGQCTPTASGSYFVIVQGANVSDETSAVSKTSSLTVDVDKPAVTLSQTTNADGTVTISMSSTDGSNTNRKIYYTTNNSTPTSSSSEYNTSSTGLVFAVGTTVKAIAIDDAANQSTTAEKQFTISLNPTVKTTSDSTDLSGQTFATVNTNGATPKTSISIGGTGFTKYRYKFDSAQWTTTEYNISTAISGTTITNLTEGSHELYVQAGDAYNYKTQPTTATATFTIDNTAPTSLAVLFDGNSTKTKIASQNGQITMSAVGSSEIRYSFGTNDAKTGTAYSSGFNLSSTSGTTIADGSEGTVKVNIAAKDSAGNWATSSKTYTVDKKKPVLTMPSAQTFATSVSGIAITFDDDGNTSTTDTGSIKYQVVSSPSATSCTTKTSLDTPTTYTGTITITGTSNQCLYAYATDEVGNSSSISSTLFTANSTAPTLSLNIVDSQKFATVSTYGATPVTDINITGSNFSSYSYEFDSNGTITTKDYNSTSGAKNLVSLLSITEGEHNVTIIGIGTDTNTTKQRKFTIDNTPPSKPVELSTQTYGTATKTISLSKVDSTDTMSYSLANFGDTNSSYATYSTSFSIDGNKTISVKLVDTVGNTAIYDANYTQDLSGKTVAYTSGWKMIALPTKSAIADVVGTLVTWDYNGTDWSNNQDNGYGTLASSSRGKGYWVKIDSVGKSIVYPTLDTITLSSNVASKSSGWHLLGNSTNSDVSKSNIPSDVNTTWIYDSGIWKFNTKDSDMNTTLNSLGYQQLTNIPAYSGFWIYK